MAAGQINRILHHLRRAAVRDDANSLNDQVLLESFIHRQDNTAFEAIVRRHGPMVLGVCRRVVGHTHDAEDAFQATFLILVRKAASIAHRELLGNGLYGVAYRTALEARSRSNRRRTNEITHEDMPHPSVESADLWSELCRF